MSVEIVKGPFWSNCLLEAVKAKIRHPSRVKVTVVPRSEAHCPHVGAQILLFQGYIRRRGLGFNQKYKERMHKTWGRPPGGNP